MSLLLIDILHKGHTRKCMRKYMCEDNLHNRSLSNDAANDIRSTDIECRTCIHKVSIVCER